MTMIHAEQFGARPDTKEDITLAVYHALQYCKNIENPTLQFQKGTYHFWPDTAYEQKYFITNHDQDPMQRTAFPILGMKNVTIDGQGSEFIFHGPMIPFILENCENITLKNLIIDWDKPMFGQGTVIRSTPSYFDVKIDADQSQYAVQNHQLLFEFGSQMKPVFQLQVKDPTKKAHAYGSGDCFASSRYRQLAVSEIEHGIIRFSGPLTFQPEIGHVIVMRYGKRENPGIFIKSSNEIHVHTVTVHHAPGMGLAAQRSANITLHKFHVMLRQGTNRLITATADAVHFTNCRGSILVDQCLFEHQLDDPLNVHGIYAMIHKRLSANKLLVKLVHSMQKGVEIASPGDRIHFVNHDTLLTYAAAYVEKAETINADFTVLTFDHDLPDSIRLDDGIENMSWVPDLTVRNCTMRANRARGLLITTPGKVFIEENTISAPGAGIKISGDANEWYESGAVQQVVIRSNQFLDCNYCFPHWGKAVIDIDPEIAHPEASPGYYHHHISIENNHFSTFETPIVYGHSIEGFVFRNNVVNRSNTYPRHNANPYMIELRAVKDADIRDNQSEDAKNLIKINQNISEL